MINFSGFSCQLGCVLKKYKYSWNTAEIGIRNQSIVFLGLGCSCKHLPRSFLSLNLVFKKNVKTLKEVIYHIPSAIESICSISVEAVLPGFSTFWHSYVFLSGITSGKGWYGQNAENEYEQIPNTGVSKAAFLVSDHKFTVIGKDPCFLELPKRNNFMYSQEAEFLSGLMMPGSNMRKMARQKLCWVLYALHLSFPSCYNHILPTP